MSVDDAERGLKGKPGTAVGVTVRRPGVSNPLSFKVSRRDPKPETVLGARRKADDSWDFFLDRDAGIAYVRPARYLPRHAYRDLARVMRDLDRQAIRGLVLDLRFNPTGLNREAVNIAALFVGDGLVVTIRHRAPEGESNSHKNELSVLVKQADCYQRFPMACLVNGETGGSCEVVAAALQDHDRALIVGERSRGATGILTMHDLGDGDRTVLRLTSAVFCRPGGKNLSKVLTSGREDEDWGVRPDKGFAIALSTKERCRLAQHLEDVEAIWPRQGGARPKAAPFRDRQLEAAVAYLRGQVRHLDNGGLAPDHPTGRLLRELARPGRRPGP
jgi:carboxyl-terminal processing protease